MQFNDNFFNDILNVIFFIQFHLNILNHTPLAHAILNNHIEIVEHLLSQPDVDINERYILKKICGI